MLRIPATSLLAAGSLALILSGCAEAPMSAPNAPLATASESKLLMPPSNDDIIPDSYIVVLNDAVLPTATSMAKTVASYRSMYPEISIDNVYSNTFRGFAARIPELRLKQLLDDPRVAWIEPDRIVRACSTSTAQTLDWGVSYIGGDSSSTTSGSGSGSVSGVEVYVIDTGIDMDHPDLNVVGGINYANPYVAQSNYDDDNGHGTHVAGIIGAKDNGSYMVGVAPGVSLYGVKVLTAQGFGTLARIMLGLDWVEARKAASTGTPMVANMSLACTGSRTFDNAVKDLITDGITVVAAAGNDAGLASNRSPARVPEAITVAAIASNATLATFSNYGSVVDLLAPGVSVLSTWRVNSVRTASGTSMAAPMVAGAAALYLSRTGNSARTPAQVSAALVSASGTWGQSMPTSTTNKVVRVTGF